LSIPRRTFRSSSEPVTPIGLPDAVETGGENSPEHAAEVLETVAAETPQDGPTEPASESAETVAAESAPAAPTALQRAQAAMGENDQAIAGLTAERNGLLLEDALDEAAIARIDAELARHQHRQKTLADRLTLLGAEQARLDAEEAARIREARIVEVERTLIERDAAVMDLRDHLVSANRAFQRVHELNLEARAGWGWGHGKLGGVLTAGSDLAREVASFIYKIGGKAPQSGGQYDPDVAPSFPGGRSPRIEMLQQPDRLPDLVAQYRAASRFASDIMRGLVSVDAVPASPITIAGQAEQSPVMPAVEITGTQSPNVPQLSPAMVEILRRQAELAARDDPESEAEYLRNGELLREMSA
jgi:hypothetical protein